MKKTACFFVSACVFYTQETEWLKMSAVGDGTECRENQRTLQYQHRTIRLALMARKSPHAERSFQMSLIYVGAVSAAKNWFNIFIFETNKPENTTH